MQNLSHTFSMPNTIVEMFTKWTDRYPGHPPINQVIKTSWGILPKIICWKIWLERNRRLFRGTNHNSKVIEGKVISQIKECLVDIKDDANLSPQDISWGSNIGLQFHPANRAVPPHKNWHIRKSEDEFKNWLKVMSRHTLFFDGAAKGNPGKAGAGGVILNPNGETSHSFAWGLGHTTSVTAEALALYQGLKILQETGIETANVIGDSQFIIDAMKTSTEVKDLKLSRLITRIKGIGKCFQSLDFFHVLRALNKEADKEANKATLLLAGIK